MKAMNQSPARALLRHRHILARRLAPLLGRAEAEDLASEAITRGLARPSPDGRQAPWIETIFRNLVRDRRRHEGRRGPLVPLPEDLAAVTATPEEVVLATERTRALSSAMPAIPGELREAVVARFLDDQGYEELAARCGITATTARTRVHRGLARLRVALSRVGAWIPTWPRGLAGAGMHAAATALTPAAVVAVAMFATSPLGRAPVGAAVTREQGTIASAKRPPARGRADTARVSASGAHDDAREEAGQSGAGESVETRSGAARRAAVHAPALAGANVAGAREDGAPAAVRRLTFDEDEVTGDLKRPGSVVVTGDPHHQRFESLIEIPASFEPSMTKMIEDM